MPHQERFLEWAARRDAVAAYMQMRLGKSLCAIRWAQAKRGVDKALIVTEPSALRGWRNEFALEGLPLCELTGTREHRQAAAMAVGKNHKWYTINKQGLTERHGDAYVPSPWAQLPWDLVVIDEATLMRSPKTNVTKVILQLLSSARYRALLTGLPNPEGPEDYVTQMLFLEGRGGWFMGAKDFWEWRAEHMNPVGFKWCVKGASLAQLRAEVRERAYFLTRKQAGLPDEKLRHTIYVPQPEKLRRRIKTLREHFEAPTGLCSNALVAMEWEGQMAAGVFDGLEHDAKVDVLLELVKGEFSGKPVVVWAKRTAELRRATAALERAGVPTGLVYGEVKQAARDAVVDAFCSGKLRALVAQPQCLKMGVDLSRAHAAIVLSNYYEYEVRAQLEDRTIHPTKSEPSLIVDLPMEGTVDEIVLDALNDKGLTARTFNARVLEAYRSVSPAARAVKESKRVKR